ncbi:MAG: hypothetical protein HLUCCA04_09145 [Oceanicaulis sp. HLUCCA04]|nr:MAG: hypothetical protein HLUCCA04_09145 [Oceanicaulis sp. HLUCCA04]
MSETVRKEVRDWVARLAWLVALGTFLAILGPYNTGGLGWPAVWIYWVGLIALGSGVGWTAAPVAERVVPGLPSWAYHVIAGFCVSLPVTAVVFGINAAMEGRIVWQVLPLTWFFVLVICAFVTGIAWLSEHMQALREAAANPPSASTASASPALTDKLPHRLRAARLISMCAEDHYLRVRTDAGEALILMRLSDAIAACGALAGAQVHRSWWVARDAVTDARKGDGRGTLILEDGSEVPVSRSYYPALREAGWF